MPTHRLLAVLVSSCGLATLATAQSIEIGPSIGYYRPLAQFDPAPYLSSDLPERPSELQGIALGANARVVLGRRAAVEGTFATIASRLPVFISPGNAMAFHTAERVNVLTLEGQLSVSPVGAASEVRVGAGPAFVQHRGEGYSRYGSPRSWGAALGIEIARSLASHFEATARAQGIVYQFNLASPPQHGRQIDGLLGLGMRWRAPAL